jgi:hypothetical protein
VYWITVRSRTIRHAIVSRMPISLENHSRVPVCSMCFPSVVGVRRIAPGDHPDQAVQVMNTMPK